MKKAGTALYRFYLAIGIAAVGLMAACVIYAVIARYFFGISHTFLEEFITTVFAFTTFWGMGICVVENEHVVIDVVHGFLPAPVKKIATIVDYCVVLLLLIVMVKYGGAYALKYGKQISMGMRVPMIWMYGLIPVCSGIAVLCVVYRLVLLVLSPVSSFERKEEA